jgi:RNA polymerase sigma-70 factor (ECF subfamily)
MNITPAEIRALIRMVTRRTGTPVHDEDLVQDVAVRALEARRRLATITHPKALLMKIVHDAVRDHWRRRRPPEDIDGIDERFLSHVPQFEFEVDRRRSIELLRRAVAQLPAPKRKLIDLFYVRGHSIGEIAQTQRRSVSAVKMDLARSRKSILQIVRILASKKSR